MPKRSAVAPPYIWSYFFLFKSIGLKQLAVVKINQNKGFKVSSKWVLRTVFSKRIKKAIEALVKYQNDPEKNKLWSLEGYIFNAMQLQSATTINYKMLYKYWNVVEQNYEEILAQDHKEFDKKCEYEIVTI